jgi:hypothetical protein
MINMKIFQLRNNENCLYFSNHERIDEEIIFNEVLEFFKKDKSFTIKDELKGPSENIYKCSIGRYNFDLILDMDYGTFIKSDNRAAIEHLKTYFDN